MWYEDAAMQGVLFFLAVTIATLSFPYYSITMERVMSRRRENERFKIIREDILYRGYHEEYASGRITERQFRKLCKLDSIKHKLDGLLRPKNKIKELQARLTGAVYRYRDKKKQQQPEQPVDILARLQKHRVP